MNKKIKIIACAFLATNCHIIANISAASQQQHVDQYLLLKHQWNLDTPDAITQYVPARLKTLVSYFEQNGLEQTIAWIDQDPDLDSYLFIINAEQPYRLLAYSRSPELAGKTPQELQKILLPAASEKHYPIERSITEIVAITRKITTYTSYWWSAPITHKPQRYIAYTSLVTTDDHAYILGATIAHKRVEAHIILPHRIKQALARITQEGLPSFAQTINSGLDYGHFFVISMQPPYRFITHRQPWAGLTAQQARTLYAPACDAPDCDIVAIVNNLVRIAQEGGGYHVYLWRNKPEDEPTLKITYLKPFDYHGNHYLVSTGLPADINTQDAQDLESLVKKSQKLIDEIGFENALSAIRQTNTPGQYIYIDETTAPYRSIVNVNRSIEGQSAAEAQRYISSFGKPIFDIEAMTEKNGAHIIKSGGGFHAYEFLADPQNPRAGTTLKVAYSLPFTHHQQSYGIGTGIPIEKAIHTGET